MQKYMVPMYRESQRLYRDEYNSSDFYPRVEEITTQYPPLSFPPCVKGRIGVFGYSTRAVVNVLQHDYGARRERNNGQYYFLPPFEAPPARQLILIDNPMRLHGIRANHFFVLLPPDKVWQRDQYLARMIEEVCYYGTPLTELLSVHSSRPRNSY